jgi:hypothetical protein
MLVDACVCVQIHAHEMCMRTTCFRFLKLALPVFVLEHAGARVRGSVKLRVEALWMLCVCANHRPSLPAACSGAGMLLHLLPLRDRRRFPISVAGKLHVHAVRN